MNYYLIKRGIGISFLFLFFFLDAYSAKRIDCKLVKVVESGKQASLAKDIKRKIDELLLVDHAIRVDAVKSPYFQIELQIRAYLKRPGHHAAYITFIEPKLKSFTMIMTYPKDLSGQRERSWLIQKIAKATHKQLRVQSALETGDYLSKNMFDNVKHLNPSKKHLSVDLIGQKTSIQANDREAGRVIKKIRIHKKEEEVKRVPNFFQRNLFKFRNKPREPEPQVETVALNPFKAEVNDYLKYDPGFSYPKFRMSGPASLFLMPSLSTHQSDPRHRYSVYVDTFWVTEDFSDQNTLENLKFDGEYYGQNISLASRFWGKWNAAIQLGWAQRDSDTQLDILHPSATGGTTFLQKSNLDASLSDTIITINHQSERGKLIFRPHFQLKLPTGSENDLISSGHADMSFGFQLEYANAQWHWASKLSFVEAGNLDIFDVSQAEINPDGYVVINLGLGRTINAVRGEKVSAVLNFSQNPMRNVSGFSDLEDDIFSIGFGAEKILFKTFTLKADVQAGLSQSASKFAAGLGIQHQF